ncbi:NAD(P)H-binding protein [Hymenobacter jeollabukensis]|uniref:SDR family NAD(P)-dependent oxidoreductase n=1 Tax=Hymenobacter jeollabukensis TaxID=2025313 RepID=A0A5R8WP73_9BACT|nr:NAD(P)H-binding protein [Hymenobacter jeollabukensis]TLM91887.1 SDR family NAD(P)-dependent oxidoreductase [Hymenobacter jeollabukensis]
MNVTSIAVLGCGWLGLPLARALAEAGHHVAGSSTTPDKLPLLAAAGISPHLLRLGPDTTAADVAPLLAGAEVLVVSVPPSRAAADRTAYARALQPVADALAAATVQSVLFISSTGVYPDEPRPMSETDAVAVPESENHLLRAEALFQQPGRPWQTTVLRLGGLMGPGRAPGRFLVGRIDLPQPIAPVNMLHLDDAVGVSRAIIEQGVWSRTLNVCAAGHPSRQQFYEAAAAQLGLPAPQFLPDGKGGKQINTDALRSAVAYDFRHDVPLAALPYC